MKIQDLNDLVFSRDTQPIYIKTNYKSKKEYSLAMDILQKIAYSVSDFNKIIDKKKKESTDLILMIIYIDWISDAFIKYKETIKKEKTENYNYSKTDDLKKSMKYIDALRAYVYAHPLSTDRHKEYGFDGNFICVDIRTKETVDFFWKNNGQTNNRFFTINYDGMFEIKDDTNFENNDYYLASYNIKEEEKLVLFTYIGCRIEDIFNVAKMYMSNLYELNDYMKKKVNQ